MGLFDGKAKREAVEAELREKLEKLQIVDLLVENVVQSAAEQEWLIKGQSYYDSCKRYVEIEKDSFSIDWRSYHDEPYIDEKGMRRTKPVADIHADLGYSFTKSGYLPLHSYKKDEKNIEISEGQVCRILAAVIRDKLAARMPSCKFSEVGTEASFTYTVPALSFKDWF